MDITEYNEKKKPKKKSHKLYALIIIILGFAILMLTVLVLFHTQSVAVSGNEYASDAELISWVNEDEYAVNTLYLLAKYRWGDPVLPPYIESVEVGLKNPWTFSMRVVEKKIMGGILQGNNYVYFDKDGFVVLITPDMREGIPHVEGLQTGEVQLYHTLEVENKSIFQNILDVTEMIAECELTPDRIECSGEDINLYFGNIRVLLGTGNMKNKILQISPILEKLEGQMGTLHLEHYSDSSQSISFRIEDITAAPEEVPSSTEGDDTTVNNEAQGSGEQSYEDNTDGYETYNYDAEGNYVGNSDQNY